MYWAPEKKSCKRAPEVHKKWKKVFFSESSPQIPSHIRHPGCKTQILCFLSHSKF